MIKQFLGHLHTINHHKWLVTRDCIRVGLISQGLKHDLSKYAPIEFFAGVKYYEGGKRSPINREKEEKGYSPGAAEVGGNHPGDPCGGNTPGAGGGGDLHRHPAADGAV